MLFAHGDRNHWLHSISLGFSLGTPLVLSQSQYESPISQTCLPTTNIILLSSCYMVIARAIIQLMYKHLRLC